MDLKVSTSFSRKTQLYKNVNHLQKRPKLNKNAKFVAWVEVLVKLNLVITGEVEWWGDISCQILPPGGSIGPRNVLQLIFSENSQKVNSATAEAREKIRSYLESIEF